MDGIDRWTGHGPMSDPGDHAAAFVDLPTDIGALNAIVQGVLIHAEWLYAYPTEVARADPVSRLTLPVARRLDDIFQRDGRPLNVERSPARRSAGTCRDFALLLCSLLRSKNIPARVRCGFADYLGDDWEDHWVCEYWHLRAGEWRLSDAQLDAVQRASLGISFDTTNVPRRCFLTAGQAWTACRAGAASPDRFGQGPVRGRWFIKVDVIRDHFVLNNRETSPWDTWRAAPESSRVVSNRDAAWLDDIAARPEQPLIATAPDWLATPS